MCLQVQGNHRQEMPEVHADLVVHAYKDEKFSESSGIFSGIDDPRHEKTFLQGLRPGKTQMPAQPKRLGRGLKFRI